jgi:prepilin-type N-terminal cleavage/methylation domain-containing protein
MKKARGFTLIEIIIVVCIVSVIAGFFSFQFAGIVGRIKIRTASRMIVSDLRLTQDRALSQQAEAEINFFRDYYASGGKIVKLPSRVTVANPHAVKFSSKGTPVVGSFSRIDLKCENAAAAIIVSPQGRIRVEE